MDKFKIFPRVEGVDPNLTILTQEGGYSITKRRDALQIIRVMQNVLHEISTMTIVDATACNGGDTLNFAMNFKCVRSIEINSSNFSALEYNVKQVYKFKNVELIKGDCTKIQLGKTDVLYLDPPWGGPSYREQLLIDLKLSEISIDIWLSGLLKEDDAPKHIFIKLPFNYDFNKLKNISFVKLDINKIHKFYLVYIENGFVKTDPNSPHPLPCSKNSVQ